MARTAHDVRVAGENEEDARVAGCVLRLHALAEEREEQVAEEWREKLAVAGETVQVPTCERV